MLVQIFHMGTQIPAFTPYSKYSNEHILTTSAVLFKLFLGVCAGTRLTLQMQRVPTDNKEVGAYSREVSMLQFSFVWADALSSLPQHLPCGKAAAWELPSMGLEGLTSLLVSWASRLHTFNKGDPQSTAFMAESMILYLLADVDGGLTVRYRFAQDEVIVYLQKLHFCVAGSSLWRKEDISVFAHADRPPAFISLISFTFLHFFFPTRTCEQQQIHKLCKRDIILCLSVLASRRIQWDIPLLPWPLTRTSSLQLCWALFLR